MHMLSCYIANLGYSVYRLTKGIESTDKRWDSFIAKLQTTSEGCENKNKIFEYVIVNTGFHSGWKVDGCAQQFAF